MIYSYSEQVNLGPYGNTISFNDSEESGSVELGEVDGVKYVFIPEDATLLEQDEAINFQLVEELPEEVRESLRNQRLVHLKKEVLRDKIELEVGDIHDLIADAMKLIEFNILLTSRIAADYLGTAPLSEEVKAVYAARNQILLDSIDQGHLTIRGSFEDPDEMMMRVMGRYSKIQNLVKNNYSEELARLGL